MRTIDPKQGELWNVDLEPTRGSEIQKVRPCIVISRDQVGFLPQRIIVPCTRWQERYTHWAWIARLEANSQNGLGKDSAADAFHIRAVALERFGRLRGTLSADELEAVINAVVATVDR